MECFNCKKAYDQAERLPRLLINCGHTLCEKCCHDRIHDKIITCPECHVNSVINSISNLPKNLALLSTITAKPQGYAHPFKTDSFVEDAVVCEKHGKPIEGTQNENISRAK
jgi:uncharacterized protein YbaR (Trm112 family)